MLSVTNKTNHFREVFDTEIMPLTDKLYTFAFHLTGSEDDADDLSQETLAKAWRFIDRYERGTNPKAWLFTIAKNIFINEYRRRAKGPGQVALQDFVTYQEKEDTPLTGSLDLRQEMYQYLIGDEVTQAVNSLPAAFRTVILLCDVEEFSYEEIAGILGIPIGTVRSRLHRARNLLKEQLRTYATHMGYEDKRG